MVGAREHVEVVVTRGPNGKVKPAKLAQAMQIRGHRECEERCEACRVSDACVSKEMADADGAQNAARTMVAMRSSFRRT